MTKKKEITLQDILNEIGSMYSTLWNRIEDIRCELVHIQELIDPAEDARPDGEKQVDIINTAYVTLTEDGCFVGGKLATQYNGEDIYRPYLCVAYFKEARDIVRKEYGYELLELHCLQSSTEGEYGEIGNPTPDKDGTCVWIRAVYKNRENKTVASRWVFNDDSGSASGCASYCAYACGRVLYSEAMRVGLFGSVAN